MYKLQKEANTGVRELINRPIINMGDTTEDYETIYPGGGIGIALSGPWTPSNYTNSISRAACYGVTVLKNVQEGNELKSKIASIREPYVTSHKNESGPVPIYEIYTLDSKEARSTWKEILSCGPLG